MDEKTQYQQILEKICRIPAFSTFFVFYERQLLEEIVTDELYVTDYELHQTLSKKMYHFKLTEQTNIMEEAIYNYKYKRLVSQLNMSDVRPLITYVRTLVALDEKYFPTKEEFKQLNKTSLLVIPCLDVLIESIQNNPKEFNQELRLGSILLRMVYHGAPSYTVEPYIKFFLKRINIYVNFLEEYLPGFAQEEKKDDSKQKVSKDNLLADVFGVELDDDFDEYFELDYRGYPQTLRQYVRMMEVLLRTHAENWAKYCNLDEITLGFDGSNLVAFDLLLDIDRYGTNVVYTHSLERLIEEKERLEEIADFLEADNIYEYCMIPLTMEIDQELRGAIKISREELEQAAEKNLEILVAEGILDQTVLDDFRGEIYGV